MIINLIILKKNLEVELFPPVLYNDHHTVNVRLNFKIAKPQRFERLMWDFGMAGYVAYRNKMRHIGTKWDVCFEYDNMDFIAQNLIDTLLNVARETIPNKMSDDSSTAWQNFRCTRNFYFLKLSV